MENTSEARGVVLLVEDEVLLREDAADILEDGGFEVLQAGDAEEALALLEERSADVLFTDVNLPGQDGLRLARMVHERWPEMGLLITSGRARISPDEMPDDGRFIGKPYLPRAVVATVEDLLAGQRRH
jgi:two-component system, response regulator PdtaR